MRDFMAFRVAELSCWAQSFKFALGRPACKRPYGKCGCSPWAASVNHFHFYGLAIEACLAEGRWARAEAYCSKLEAYAAAEPLPRSALMVERGQALARLGRGERGDAIAGALTGLRTRAAGAQMSHLLPALDTALSAMA